MPPGGKRKGAGRPAGAHGKVSQKLVKLTATVLKFLSEEHPRSASPFIDGLIRNSVEFRLWRGEPVKHVQKAKKKTGTP